MAYTRVQPKALIRLEKDVVTDEEQVEAYLRKERCLRRSEGAGPRARSGSPAGTDSPVSVNESPGEVAGNVQGGSMLDNKVVFLFYGLAVACFVLAAVQSSGRGGVGSRGAMARVGLLPLGLALYVFPQMWNAAAAGF